MEFVYNLIRRNRVPVRAIFISV